MRRALSKAGISAPVTVLNDADATAAGVAAKHDRLDHFIRLWALGYGIGFGRYPYAPGIWEGGHAWSRSIPQKTIVAAAGAAIWKASWAIAPCGCAFSTWSRRKFLPTRKPATNVATDFVRLWHRSLAAATANSIHMQGPGRFYYTGFNVRFLDMKLLQHYLQQMVTMSPLQNYTLEIVPMSDDLAVTGAAIAASQAAKT